MLLPLLLANMLLPLVVFAKPFNPLLGETYEYARPDKGFRFFIEQVSHHPPVGAAWAESTKWDYYVSISSHQQPSQY